MNEYDLWFILLKANVKIKNNLVKRFKSAKEIWYYTVNEYNEKNNLLLEGKEINSLKNDIIKNNISLVTYFDKEYPSVLRKYDDSPYALFYKGNITSLNDFINVAVVGSRECSPYGSNVARIITKELCDCGINIISGFARGIDSNAHLTCIDNNSYTCAVLGCGLDIVYPKENSIMVNGILDKGGCIMSQFVPGTKPLSYNFPIRNRIISALSCVTIVVEAGLKSGSLITASAALEQGKDVMAVPGSIFSKNSIGTNKLIKDGAFPLTSCEDIFELLGIDYNKKHNKQKKVSLVEKKVYSVISDNPMHIDDIIKVTGVDITQIYELLFEMQLKKEIMCLNGNYYVRVNDYV
ncbi:DNA-processing protein DprA [Clostridium akagii]|uniref:DNA-processing protein DprA n=1 Tax=Clostridium akagii TaxID=91623 RepID=UPI00047D9B33|nr:DNA-processing protein DprA [Clostridium akagii]